MTASARVRATGLAVLIIVLARGAADARFALDETHFVGVLASKAVSAFGEAGIAATFADWAFNAEVIVLSINALVLTSFTRRACALVTHSTSMPLCSTTTGQAIGAGIRALDGNELARHTLITLMCTSI